MIIFTYIVLFLPIVFDCSVDGFWKKVIDMYAIVMTDHILYTNNFLYSEYIIYYSNVTGWQYLKFLLRIWLYTKINFYSDIVNQKLKLNYLKVTGINQDSHSMCKCLKREFILPVVISSVY